MEEKWKNFIAEFITFNAEGATAKIGVERMNRVIDIEAEEIKKNLIIEAKRKRAELLNQMEQEANALQTANRDYKLKLDKYNEDIKKLNEFKRNFR